MQETTNGYKQIQVKTRLAKRLKTLAFNHDVELRRLASEIVDDALQDETKLREILEKVKAKR